MTNWRDKLSEPHNLTQTHLRRAVIICVLLLLALMVFSIVRADAQDVKPAPVALKAALGSYLAFSVLDAQQTGSCLSAGRCRETNPLLKPFAGKPSALVTAKLAANSGVAYGIWRLRKTHPKAALVLAITAAGFQAAVITSNAKQARRTR